MAALAAYSRSLKTRNAPNTVKFQLSSRRSQSFCAPTDVMKVVARRQKLIAWSRRAVSLSSVVYRVAADSSARKSFVVAPCGWMVTARHSPPNTRCRRAPLGQCVLPMFACAVVLRSTRRPATDSRGNTTDSAWSALSQKRSDGASRSRSRSALPLARKTMIMPATTSMRQSLAPRINGPRKTEVGHLVLVRSRWGEQEDTRSTNQTSSLAKKRSNSVRPDG